MDLPIHLGFYLWTVIFLIDHNSFFYNEHILVYQHQKNKENKPHYEYIHLLKNWILYKSERLAVDIPCLFRNLWNNTS